MSEQVVDPRNVEPPVAAKPQTPFQRVVSDFCEDKLAVFGLVLVALAAFVAIAAPWISPQNPFDIGGLDLLLSIIVKPIYTQIGTPQTTATPQQTFTPVPKPSPTTSAAPGASTGTGSVSSSSSASSAASAST